MAIMLNKFYTQFIIFIIIIGATGSDSNDSPSSDDRHLRAMGRIVKLYSGTRPEPILCISEGFKMDPHNCAMFYRCVSSGNGRFTVFRFQCPPGTIYDPETEVCNHPRSTQRSECGGFLSSIKETTHVNDIESNVYNEIPSPIGTNKPIYTTSTPKTPAKTTIKPAPSFDSMHFSTSSSPYPWASSVNHIYTDGSPVSYPAKPSTVTTRPLTSLYHETTTPSTTSFIPHSSSRDNICTSDGFKGDSDDCRKFYRCVANQRGGFTRYEFYCSDSTIWDDYYQICNHVWAVKRSKCGSKSDKISSSNTLFANEMNEANVSEKESQKHSIRNGNTIQQQLQISHGASVTQTQTQIGNGPVEQIQKQINYGDRINETKDKMTKQNQTQISYGDAISQTQTQFNYGNKGIQTQLQIDHSKEASQSQTQITDSSSKKPPTSTRHYDSEEVNKQTNQDCTQVGFIGDSHDCHIFYRCVDNGLGGFNKIRFDCSQGTAWDPSLQTCNHEWAVKGCSSHGSTESTTFIITTKIYKPIHTTTSTESYHQIPEAVGTEDSEDSGYGHLRPEEISTSSSTSTLPTTKDSNGEECTSDGFKGDANNCKIFYRCVENSNGGFTKHAFECGEGTVWDPDIQACNHPWAVEKCGEKTSSDINHITTTEKVTTSSTVTTYPSETAPSHDYGGNDDPGYGPSNNDVHTATTSTTSAPSKHPSTISQEICKSSGFIGDKHDCTKFYRCVDDGVGGFHYYQFTCSKGTAWDHTKGACDYAENVDSCSESSTEPTTQNVVNSSTSDSIKNITILTPSTTTATSSTEFSYKDTDKCLQEGYIGDSKNCKKFYRCVNNGDGSYSKYEFICGEGTLWDPEIKTCNHASAVDNRCTHQETTPQYHSPMNDEINNQYPSNADVDSDVKTTISFIYSTTTQSPKQVNKDGTCVSTGYFGDNNTCKKFYRCVDDGKGGFIRYEYVCSEGTVWDQNITACNYAWAVKECNTTENNTIQTQTSESASEISTTPKGISCINCANNGTTPTTTCSQEGFMGDRNNCKTFYRCVNNGKGGFTKYEYSCGEGTFWNQDILSCDHITSDKECENHGTTSTSKEPQYIYDETILETTTIRDNNNYHMPTRKPVASSNDCTSEGFYGDKNDCKKFYRCVDNGQGGYTQYQFNCGDGTVWDHEIQACNHESDSKCSGSSSSSTTSIENQTSVANNIQTTKIYDSITPKPSTEDKQDNEYNGNDSESDICMSEGYYGNKNDCRKFYRCVDNGKGGYIKYNFTCSEGTAWDSSIKTCNHINQSNCHSGSVMHDEENAAPSSETTTTTSTTQKSTTTSESSSDSTTQNTCDREGYFGNTQDCKKFYRCVDDGKGGFTKYDFTCADGTIWDSDVTTCNHPQDVTNPSCNQTYEVSTPSSSSSPTPEVGSETESSKEPDGTKKPEKTDINCTKAGFYAHPKDCRKFYRCVDWDGDGTKFSVFYFDCAEGTIWDPAIETCNHEESVYPPRDCNSSASSATEKTTTTQKESTTESSTLLTTESTTYSTTETTTKSTEYSISTESTSTTTEQSEEVTTEHSVESSTEQSGEGSTDKSTEGTTEKSTEGTTEKSTEGTTEKSTEGTTEKSTEGTTEKSTEGTTEKSTAGTTEKSTEGTTEKSTEGTTEKSTEGTTDKSTEGSTEKSTEGTTEKSTEGTTEKSTEATTEKLGESSTEQSTEGSTEQSVEGTTEQSAHASTEQSTEGTTEQTTEGTTEQMTEGTTERSPEGITQQSGETTTEISGETTTQQTTDKTTEASEGTTDKPGSENASEGDCPETDDDQYLYVCPSSFRRHPKYCNLFYQCDENENSHDIKIAVFNCPNNTIYDESKTKCVDESKADKQCKGQIADKRRVKRKDRIGDNMNGPIVVSKESYACLTPGYYKFEKDSECSPAFLKCIETKKSRSNHLRGFVYQCPPGFLFWSVSRRCEPLNKIIDCRRSIANDWSRRWEIPVERKNVAW